MEKGSHDIDNNRSYDKYLGYLNRRSIHTYFPEKLSETFQVENRGNEDRYSGANSEPIHSLVRVSGLFVYLIEVDYPLHQACLSVHVPAFWKSKSSCMILINSVGSCNSAQLRFITHREWPQTHHEKVVGNVRREFFLLLTVKMSARMANNRTTDIRTVNPTTSKALTVLSQRGWNC